MAQEQGKTPAEQGSPQDAQDLDEFDAAMAEATSDDEAPGQPAASDPPADDGNDTDEPPAPADKAAADAPPADKASPGGSPQDDDVWANAPSELRQRYDESKRDYELRLKSIQGRQSAADREVARLRQQIADMQNAGKGSGSESGTGEQSSAGEASDDRFKQLLEDYPEIAGPLVEELNALKAQLKPIEEGVSTVQQEREAAFYIAQQQKLEEAHPDWLDTLKDDRFGGWLQEQPRRVQEAFERNRQAIVDGEEAAWVVGSFKEGLGIGKQPDPQDDPKKGQDERRAKQLASGRDYGRGSGPPAANEIPDDFDSAVNAYADQADRKMAAR